MQEKKQNVRYEFLNFTPNTITGNFTTTLVLEKPASVKFTYCGTGFANDAVFINTVYKLEPLHNYLVNTSNYPFELILNNNFNEIDKTIYTIQIFGQSTSCNLLVTIKYLTN